MHMNAYEYEYDLNECILVNAYSNIYFEQGLIAVVYTYHHLLWLY
jgi:hypothetical protein